MIQSIKHIMDKIYEAKRLLRKQCRQTRLTMGDEARNGASQEVCRRIGSWPFFQQSRAVLTYMPMRGEADLTRMLLDHPEKNWLLPRILPDGRMLFHPYDADRLVRHPYGMLEPAPELPAVPAEGIELVLVPGLAYDRQGWRLGYGGGYFDRFLAAVENCIRLGVTYNALLFDHLPHDKHDVPVQYVVTEAGFFHCPELIGG